MKTKEQIQNDLHDALQYALKPLIGKMNTSYAQSEIKSKMMDVLTKYNKESEVETDVLWNTYSAWQKFVWFLANKVFTFVGRLKRREIEKLNASLYSEESEEYYRMPIPAPWWAVDNPKGCILVTTVITNSKPIEFLELNLEIKGDQ